MNVKIYITIFIAGLGLGWLLFVPSLDWFATTQPTQFHQVPVTDMVYQKELVMQAKTEKEAHDKVFKKMEDFCGKNNVNQDFWDSENFGVVGCIDYSIVELK